MRASSSSSSSSKRRSQADPPPLPAPARAQPARKVGSKAGGGCGVFAITCSLISLSIWLWFQFSGRYQWRWPLSEGAKKRALFLLDPDGLEFSKCAVQQESWPSTINQLEARRSFADGTAAQGQKKINLLSIDVHISPIADLKQIVASSPPLSSAVEIVDRSLSGSCERSKSCAAYYNLRVIDRGDPETVYLSSRRKRQFYRAYALKSLSTTASKEHEHFVDLLLGSMIRGSEDLVAQADAMVCNHPTGNCELIMPFNRSTIVWATTRFELGREKDATRFCGFLKNLKAMSSRPGSVILANSRYDQQYVRFFTGVTPLYVPSFGAYIGQKWSWSADKSWQRTILVLGYKPFYKKEGIKTIDGFLRSARKALRVAGVPWRLSPLRRPLGQNYRYEELVSFPAVLHLPYQVSVMSFFEQYRAGIPIIAPSLSLLSKWHQRIMMVKERTWEMAYHNLVPYRSILSRHASLTDKDMPFDPNDEENSAAMEWWLALSDYYHFPHVILFDSWEDLADKLKTVNLTAVSEAMMRHNEKEEKELRTTWEKILANLPPRMDIEASDEALRGLTFEERMDAIYGEGNWADY